ncbi:MAG: V-type ATP synthase subunit A [Parcubacteria group bacterium GW2011_GWA2_38_13b]|nr:MAG: V-type ATP synthase subunit A [Parcubacteria group bacterium GW2011_GWA2_38_13b]
MKQGKIIKVSGPLVVAEGMESARMYDVVKIGKEELIGEIIEIKEDKVSVQVYEETSGIGPGDPAYLTGAPLTVELGPGLMGSIYDGVQRPLDLIENVAKSPYITRGINVSSISREKIWKFKAIMKIGEEVQEGDVLGEVQETILIKHKIMTPPGIKGKISKIGNGDFKIEDIVAMIKDGDAEHKITMLQKWPIRSPRPIQEKLSPTIPLITGQRVIDTFFTITKGGTACVPGPFGSGKTVVQHQLAKWADADIIVFIGCGERGNEMTDVLIEFPELKDPKSGEPLMKRTILIANTSNMPVAAREASVYTGITIAEYYRDMGYNVALMADSTSRWAEALREISGRLEEMPGEEGYPAYLGSRTASFYERAGIVKTLGKDNRQGSLTVVGAVSPPGGDLSEPVTQNTLRVTKVFWGLDSGLAYKRHFPAIHWLKSYSLYSDDVKEFLSQEIAPDFQDLKTQAMALLQKEAELEEIVRLVGIEALSSKEQLVLHTTKSIREDFLHQSAFDEIDTYTSLKKQYLMLKTILKYHKNLDSRLTGEKTIQDVIDKNIQVKIAKMKFIKEDNLSEIEKLI